MHELGIVVNVVETVERLSKQYGVSEIAYVKMDVGEFSGAVAKYLLNLWDMGTNYTICQGTQLIINEIPGMVVCRDCSTEYRLTQNVVDEKGHCPNCGSLDFTIERGRELMVTEIGTKE